MIQRFVVIGLGTFGLRLAKALTADGAEVIAIDRDAQRVETARDEVTLAVRLDSTDQQALEAQSVADAHAAVVAIGDNFEACALTVVVLRAIGVPRIYARAENDIQAQVLRSVGADEAVNPEHESAFRWAHRLTLPNLKRYIDLGTDHAIVYAVAPEAFCHKTLVESGLRTKYGVNLVAIKREVGVQTDPAQKMAVSATITVPQPDTTILPGDVLILVGSNESLSRLPTE
jgi:trk system potassium uptake protein TrkA